MEELFHYCYPAPTSSLPMDDSSFIAELEKFDLLPGDTKLSLKSESTSKEKASFFLDNVIKPQLKENTHIGFNKLLDIMINSECGELRNLAANITSAARIKSELLKDSKSSLGKFCTTLFINILYL